MHKWRQCCTEPCWSLAEVSNAEVGRRPLTADWPDDMRATKVPNEKLRIGDADHLVPIGRTVTSEVEAMQVRELEQVHCQQTEAQFWHRKNWKHRANYLQRCPGTVIAGC